MSRLIQSMHFLAVLSLIIGLGAGPASAQTGLETLPEGWRNQPINEFISMMRAESRNGLSDTDRALAASQWMDLNDWTTASRMYRVQLVELLDSDRLPDTKRFSVRWTGYLVPDHTGDYTLSLWRYYTSPAIETKIWLDGVLVLDSTGDGDGGDKTFETDELSLTSQERVPIRVEFSFDLSRPEARHARPNVVLSWQSNTMPQQIIPNSNLEPPDDFISEGTNGLQGEYYGSSNFDGLVQTRLDPELGFLWHYFAILPEQGDRQREIAVAMIPEMLESVNDPTIIGNEKSDAFWCVNDLEEVLTLEETMGILDVLKQYPERNAARSPREVYIGYTRFRYLPGGVAADLVIEWCEQNPMRQSQFGTYPNYNKSEYYGNYDYLWRTANQMSYNLDWGYLQNAIVEAQGTCNLSLATLLTFVHKKNSALPQWRSYLESRIDDPEVTGDVKASWLLARAFADEVPDVGEPEPLAGRAWLDLALEEATSVDMKRYVIGEIVCKLAAGDRCDEAVAMMDSQADLFEDGEAAVDIARWRTEVAEIDQSYAAAHQRAEQARHDRRVYELQRRLESAQERGDAAAVARYSRLVQHAQQSQFE